MSNLKSIQRKIASIKNTRQITKAMKMVAGARFKKSHVAMDAFRPYAEAYNDIIKNISRNSVLYSHPFFKNSDNDMVGVVIISTDRGLCGSFNMNIFKLFFEEFRDKGMDSSRIRLYIIGRKGVNFFKNMVILLNLVPFFQEAILMPNYLKRCRLKYPVTS